MGVYQIRLSKFLSYILRHAPGDHGLELDKNGYADLGDVLKTLSRRFKQFKEDDLLDLVKNDPKGRFEITGDRIRATYGHSVDVVPRAESVTPPEVLYHGTSEESAARILEGGLSPMGRQFVHLSESEKDAYMVGSRHTDNPVILEILAGKATADNIEFYREGNLFLTKHVPGKYIRRKSK